MHLLFSMSVQIQHLHALPIPHPTGGGGVPVGRTGVGDDSSLHPLPLADLIDPYGDRLWLWIERHNDVCELPSPLAAFDPPTTPFRCCHK